MIAKDTFDESLKLNSFTQNPAANTFADPQDGFQIFQVGVSSSIPNALKDDSTNGQSNDSLGVVNTAVKTDRWFGINDLENPNNVPGTGVVTWEFDIAGAFDMQVSIDMAAMGDFEAEDTYNWTYQIDSGSILPLFTSSVDEDGMATYLMADSDPVMLNDPLLMTDAQNDTVQLDNTFQTLTSLITGIGNTLTIQLNVANNADEPYAFDNLIIEGTTFVEFLAADFNQDGNVDDIDLTKWQMDYALGNGSDADADGDTDGADFLVWQRQYGQSTLPLLASTAAVPEPSGFLLLTLAALVSGSLTRPTR